MQALSRPGRTAATRALHASGAVVNHGTAIVRRTIMVLGLWLLFVALTPTETAAQERLIRRFSGGQNLQPPTVALAQDSTGFLWVGTRAGLFRYDGARFSRWAPDSVPRAVGTITVSSEGMVVAVDADGRLLELTGSGARVLPGRPRRSPDYLNVAVFDSSDRLWVITGNGTIEWRDSLGVWQPSAAGALIEDLPRRLFSAGSRGGVLAAAGAGLWHMREGTEPQLLLEDTYVVDVLTWEDGTIIALAASATLLRLRPGARPDTLDWGGAVPRTRAIGLAERHGTIWVGTDLYLLARTPGRPPEVLGARHDIRAGGPLLVDREGSLWQGGFTALSQFPEPDTRVWDRNHGLGSDHTRYLARSRDVLWVTTWQAPAFIQRQQERWQPGRESRWRSVGTLCPDGEGAVWTASNLGVIRLLGDQVDIVHPDIATSFSHCSPASDGGAWIATQEGVRHLSRDGSVLTTVAPLPATATATRGEAATAVQAVLEDRVGRLWAGSYERMCHAPVDQVSRGAAAPWTCEPLPAGSVHLNTILELPGEVLWAPSSALGLLRRTETGWDVLPDNHRLPTRSLLNLVPSPRGGIWLVGAGILQRVEPQPAGAGWEVIERLGAWHGLPTVGGGDLLEEDDGTVWIATSLGVAHVPASVRTAEPLPPRMALVEARIEGERTPTDGELVVPADRNHLELRFAALTFRDPSLVRYQVRLSEEDSWVDTDEQPTVTWLDLPPGRHQPQVRATIDGVSWSPAPAVVALRVLPPWFRTTWAMLGFVLITGLLLFAAYRARLAYLLGLERQRTRIAMDLHDEMGSGLASIGILAAVLSDRDRDGGRRIAREVAATAEELGTALSDIVWSLDPHGATLEELAARMSEHGGRLFADDVEFDTEFPSQWPSVPLPLPVLRNVLLIGLEALHNAARHAGARSVLLSLLPEQDDWVMTVRDDGVGLPAGRRPSGSGRGLRTMRRRAEEIQGTITFSAPPGGGTIVQLRFRTHTRGRLLPRWLRVGPRTAADEQVAPSARSAAQS